MNEHSGRRRHTVTVTIGGEKHVLRSDAPPEYTHAVAAHVDRTVAGLGDAQPLQPHRTAILAALFITDELFRTRAELQALREQLGAGADRLGDALERAARAELPDSPGDAPAAFGEPARGEELATGADETPPDRPDSHPARKRRGGRSAQLDFAADPD